MGHKPNQRARKKRREREAKRKTFVDDVRAEAKRLPAVRRAEERRTIDAFIETSHRACRTAVRRTGRANGTMNVRIGNAPVPHMANAAYRKLAGLLHKDGLRVDYFKKQVTSNMQTYDDGVIFVLTW